MKALFCLQMEYIVHSSRTFFQAQMNFEINKKCDMFTHTATTVIGPFVLNISLTSDTLIR